MEEEAPDSAMVVVAEGEAGAAAALREGFRQLGFEVGPFVGISFAISAESALFFRTFGGRFVDAAAAGGPLPLDALPEAMRGAVAAILIPDRPQLH